MAETALVRDVQQRALSVVKPSMIRAGELAPASALVPHQLHAPLRVDIVKCADFPIFAARNNRGDRKDVDGLGEIVYGRRDFLEAAHLEPSATEHFLIALEKFCGLINMDGKEPSVDTLLSAV